MIDIDTEFVMSKFASRDDMHKAMKDEITSLRAQVEALSKDKWISVNDRLPTEVCYVDVWIRSTGNKSYGVRRCNVLFIPAKTKQFVTGFESELMYISHWRNEPRPPAIDKAMSEKG